MYSRITCSEDSCVLNCTYYEMWLQKINISSNFSQDMSDDEYYISFGHPFFSWFRLVWPNHSGILYKQQMKTRSPLIGNTAGSARGAVQLYFLLYYNYLILSYCWDLLIISDQPNFNDPFNGTLLTPILSPLGTIISF